MEYARGRALQGLARFDEARAAYQAVIDARKGGDLAARAQLMRGETFFHQKAYHEALREFLKVDILYDAPSGRRPRSWRREKSTNSSTSGPTPPKLIRSCCPSSPTTPTPPRPRPGSTRLASARGRGRDRGRPTSPEKRGGGPGLPRFSCIFGPIV